MRGKEGKTNEEKIKWQGYDKDGCDVDVELNKQIQQEREVGNDKEVTE